MIPGSASSERYDRLWAEAERHFRSGQVEIDPHLRDRASDRRLGLTVIGRPSAGACHRFASFLKKVKQIAPGQHFYRDDEFHLTILSLFTATDAFEPYWDNRAAYQQAVDQALLSGQPFTVHYQGVNASRNAVMIQGFSQGRQLDLLRDGLRQTLNEAGFGGGLDQRYAIETAHSTVMRFKAQPTNLPGLLTLLSDNRATAFGSTTFDELLLVKNVWYMSHDKVEVLARYSLATAGRLVVSGEVP
jgi:2'-5' RNA ligase